MGLARFELASKAPKALMLNHCRVNSALYVQFAILPNYTTGPSSEPSEQVRKHAASVASATAD